MKQRQSVQQVVPEHLSIHTFKKKKKKNLNPHPTPFGTPAYFTCKNYVPVSCTYLLKWQNLTKLVSCPDSLIYSPSGWWPQNMVRKKCGLTPFSVRHCQTGKWVGLRQQLNPTKLCQPLGKLQLPLGGKFQIDKITEEGT